MSNSPYYPVRLTSLILLLASSVNAGTLLDYDFGDGSGTSVTDLSGNGNDGMLVGFADTAAGAGVFNSSEGWVQDGGLSFLDDSVRSYVDTPLSLEALPGDFTLEFEANYAGASGWAPIFGSNAGGCCGQSIFFGVHQNQNNVEVRIQNSGGPVGPHPWTSPPDETSHHIALVFEAASNDVEVFVDGVSVATGSKPAANMAGSPTLFRIANVGWSSGEQWAGILYGVSISDEKLDPSSFVIPNRGNPALASEPEPASGELDASRRSQLRWTAGAFANSHNVYFGADWADVNAASVSDPRGVLVSEAQASSTLDPGPLEFSATYFWRVDEVNGAPDFSVHKGVVWDFTVEPFSIPISNITATASSSFGPSVPENTVNGSGLVDDLHGTSANDMWISTGLPATIEYAFDRIYKLHELWVWNSNQLIEAFVGFGAKDLVIEYSIDGVNWIAIDGVDPLAQAPGTEGYAHNNVIDLAGVAAQHVRLTINSAHGFAPQASLSEVRFFYIPTNATRPSPESGASDVSAGITLAWGRDGREADRHDVYVGTDPDNLPLVGTVMESSLDTAALGLLMGETYHWRVDEVNDTEDPSTWQGSTWSFSTADRIIIDDMESYADEAFLEIWAAWVDGFEDPSNGALVGNGPAGLPETTITHGSGQSLPLHYDNTGVGLSEATRTFDPAQDWTIGSPETLVVHFQGALNNSGGGQVYVKINNTKVVYDANPTAISSPFWTQWNIDLAGVGMVNSLTVGVEGAGAQGVLYVDDLILYRLAPEPVVAMDPGTANLVAYYALDNNAQDSTGNGHHGTLEGSPIYISPGWDGTGACMQFGPQDARITVESFDVAGSGITLAAWINPSLFTNDARMLSKSDGGSTANHYWAMVLSGGGENNLQFRLRTDSGATTSHTSSGSPLTTDEWTHVAVTWDAADPTMRLYKNVQEISSTGKAGSSVATGPGVKIGIGNQSISALAQGPGNEIRPFDGLVDEVRVYDRGLSAGELRHVAFGR